MEGYAMSLIHWPKKERPREKLIASGSNALSDSELIAVLLGTGSRGENAIDAARRVLGEAGGLAGLMRMEADDLLQLNGLGPASVARIKAATELGRRSLTASLERGQILTSPGATSRYLRILLAHEPCEVFWMIMLDNQHRVLRSEALCRGTIDSATIYPREVVKACLKNNSSAVIFAHNHPSGSLEPSISDRNITKKLLNALNGVEIRVLDHFIVSDQGACSMAELGLL